MFFVTYYCSIIFRNLIMTFQAPERLGAIVRVLLSGGACEDATIKNMIASFRKTSLEDEYAAPDVVNSAFSRFLAAAAI